LDVAERWELRLYVAGQTPKSLAALANLMELCETHLHGKYRIEVIDLLVHPERARADQIVALPTLVRKLPPPLKRSSATSRTGSAPWSAWNWSRRPEVAQRKAGAAHGGQRRWAARRRSAST